LRKHYIDEYSLFLVTNTAFQRVRVLYLVVNLTITLDTGCKSSLPVLVDTTLFDPEKVYVNTSTQRSTWDVRMPWDVKLISCLRFCRLSWLHR
jgi:hypothetical protein